jgi:hypothetical protein
MPSRHMPQGPQPHPQVAPEAKPGRSWRVTTCTYVCSAWGTCHGGKYNNPAPVMWEHLLLWRCFITPPPAPALANAPPPPPPPPPPESADSTKGSVAWAVLLPCYSLVVLHACWGMVLGPEVRIIQPGQHAPQQHTATMPAVVSRHCPPMPPSYTAQAAPRAARHGMVTAPLCGPCCWGWNRYALLQVPAAATCPTTARSHHPCSGVLAIVLPCPIKHRQYKGSETWNGDRPLLQPMLLGLEPVCRTTASSHSNMADNSTQPPSLSYRD